MCRFFSQNIGWIVFSFEMIFLGSYAKIRIRCLTGAKKMKASFLPMNRS